MRGALAKPFGVAALLGSVLLAGCGGSSCQPQAAYTIPAYWEKAHYAYVQSYDWQRGKYYWHRQYQAPTYHPAARVPAVTCSAH